VPTCIPISYRRHSDEDRLVPPSWRHGTVIHRALEAAYRERQAGTLLDSTIPRAVAEFEAAWIAEHMPDDPAWRTRSRDLVVRTLTDDPIGVDHVLGVEQPFRAVLESGRRFGGYADLVLRRDHETIEIDDNKVTRHARTAEELATDPQLNLYGWFALREWPWARRVIATHHYPPLGRTVTVELTGASMRATVGHLDAVAARAEADTVFEPKPGPECASCPWFARCPAQQAAPEASVG
jgi:hypothetical protein